MLPFLELVGEPSTNQQSPSQFAEAHHVSDLILTDLYAGSIVDQPAISSRFAAILTKRVSVVLGLWGEAGIGKTFAARQVLGQLSCRQQSAHASVPILELARNMTRIVNLPLWAKRLEDRVQNGDHLEDETVLDLLAAKLLMLAPFVLDRPRPERLPTQATRGVLPCATQTLAGTRRDAARKHPGVFDQ